MYTRTSSSDRAEAYIPPLIQLNDIGKNVTDKTDALGWNHPMKLMSGVSASCLSTISVTVPEAVITVMELPLYTVC